MSKKRSEKIRYGKSGMHYKWLNWRRLGLYVSILHAWDGKLVFEDGPDKGQEKWLEFGGVQAITKNDLEKLKREHELAIFGEISREVPGG